MLDFFHSILNTSGSEFNRCNHEQPLSKAVVCDSFKPGAALTSNFVFSLLLPFKQTLFYFTPHICTTTNVQLWYIREAILGLQASSNELRRQWYIQMVRLLLLLLLYVFVIYRDGYFYWHFVANQKWALNYKRAPPAFVFTSWRQS